MKEGIHYLRLQKQKEFSTLSKEWFFELVKNGEFIFDFKKILYPKLPKDTIDIGVINQRHWYLTEYGIVCYARGLYGYIGKTRLCYYAHETRDAKEPKTYILPYNDIRKSAFLHVWFLNRMEKPTQSKAKLLYVKDMEKAKRRYNDKKYTPLTLNEEGRHDSKNCKDGIFWDEVNQVFMIEKVNPSHHYFFVNWLTLDVREMIEANVTRKSIKKQ